MARRIARGDGRVDGALLVVALVLGIFARSLPEARTDGIAGGMRRTVLAPLMSLQERSERARRALSSHDVARITADSAVLQALDAGRLHDENERLRQLLGLGARLRSGYVAAEALHGPMLGEEHTVVLNAGALAGVEPFSAVIAPEGIVGYVRSVDQASSVAIVWPHPDFRVSGIAAKGTATGIVSAHLATGAGRYLLELRGVPFRSPLAGGTLIVSSGIGGTFPRGIPVGTVLNELPSSEGWERNYLLLPAVHAADAGTVLILLPGQTHADPSSVWAVPDSVAPAVRRANAAGDSLSRSAAAAAAKRDSVQRAAAARDSAGRAGWDTARRLP